MSYFIVSSFINTFASIACCVFVILSKPKSRTTQCFSFFTLTVSLWSGFYFLWITSNNEINALFFSRLLNLSALFIPTSFFHFCCHLLNKKYTKVAWSFYIFNIFILSIGFTELFISHVGRISIFQYWPFPGKLFILLLGEFFILTSFSLYMIYSSLKGATGNERKKLQILFYGLLLGFIGGGTNFPLFYRIEIIPFGNAFVVMYVIAVTYTIFRYQLMNIKIILKRSIVYTILITLITLIFFLLTYLTEHVIKQYLGYQSFLISVLSATVIATAFVPLRNLIQIIVERYLFRGSFAELAEENKMLRQEIIQSERLKSVSILASGMAHEIKNPLTALKTFSEYLPKKMNDKEFLEKFAPIINNEVNRIDSLVHELLDFAKPAPLQLKPTEVHTLLDNTLEFLSNDLLKHKIALSKSYRLPKDLLLKIDPNQFKQAILNILLNSIEAMPSGGELSITTSQSTNAECISIKIQDNGVGISQEDLTHIFDPFFSKKDGGTGLGLSITHEIIKNHNGRIFVEGKIGSGAAFIIELPL